MKRRAIVTIGAIAVIGAAILLASHPQTVPPGNPDLRPQNFTMLQEAYPAPWTATPAPSGGVFPTPHPEVMPSTIISNYNDFGDYASGLVVAENAIESGVPGIGRLNSARFTWVTSCDAGDGFGFSPSSPDARTVLASLLNGATPRVQGVYRDGTDVFTMIVTGLTSARVSWPKTPTPVPTPTGSPTPRPAPGGPLRRPTLSNFPSEGYAVGVSLIVPAKPRKKPIVRGLYACEKGYYRGIFDLFFGWNIDSIYYARN